MSSSKNPDLPIPARSRWQPLRLGLVELFHYDSEEFWFRDGHLLLRGNNGTGKSKVLSLTLPFLLDAQLYSARIEPDGDRGKKMSWNLLLGRHDRRMGYTWIEFGRISESGASEYLTLGCGLLAVAARTQIDSWFFVLENQRIGQDLWLTSPQRVVLTRERLRDALEGHGQVFDTAAAYRRAVDVRLFRLGTARYTALIDTLIQLRQPQLSKKPDEANLSNALTEALPPMSTDLLTDVADALNQLEEYRRELQEYEALERAVASFNQRYRVYAATQARRQAKTLRSAQTGFDAASRTLNEGRERLTSTNASEELARAEYADAEAQRTTSRIRLDQLQDDPAMADAKRLEQASRDALSRHDDAERADRACDAARARFERENQLFQERIQFAEAAEEALAEARQTVLSFAEHAGIAGLCYGNPLATMDASGLGSMTSLSIDTSRTDLSKIVATRREQVTLLQRRCNGLDQAVQEHAHQQQLYDERKDDAEEALARREEAETLIELRGRELIDAWESHFNRLSQLRIDPGPPVEALAEWVASLDGNNPALDALRAAQQFTSERHAEHGARLSVARTGLDAEKAILQAEQVRLIQGEDAAPPPSPYREPGAREGRAGAPLWQLVDFRDNSDAAMRAGLEAALEAAGLLDAWVTPEGGLNSAAGERLLHDTHWVELPVQPRPLSAWLEPTEQDGSDIAAVSKNVLRRLLDGVACSDTDDGSAAAWVSLEGHFRLGALSGTWSKPAATYIGFAARAAACALRLDEIAALLNKIDDELCVLEERFADHARDRQHAVNEWQTAPRDEPLRAAHSEASARAREFNSARTRLEQAEEQLSSAAEKLASERQELETDATDLHLPVTHAALQAIEQSLRQLADSLHQLFQGIREVRHTRLEVTLQQDRHLEALADDEKAIQEAFDRKSIAEEAQIRLEILLASIGAQVDELKQRLREARDAVAAAEMLSKERNEALRNAGEERARAEQKVHDSHALLTERTQMRQAAIAHLQGFAATGLLACAMPDAEIPDLRMPWTIEPALTLARRTEQHLANVKEDDDAWARVQSQISHDYSELGRALAALSHQAQGEMTDYGLTVAIVYQNRPERPDQLSMRLTGEIAQRRELLTAGERKVLENHLQAEIAAAVQKLLQDAERQLYAINEELEKRPTSTGVRFRLKWETLPEGADGAPIGLEAARKRLLNTSTDLWSPEDRRVVGEMLHQRIGIERTRADEVGGGSLLDQLARALDYRRWHRFRVQRWQDGQWRALSGPASSGERALGLTVPLFAAVASYYSQSSFAHAPRLVLLDEAFAGIDDAARAHCMGLIREFDLDFVITSEREWACYAELPGVAICQLQRREGVHAVHVSRWTWDGRARRLESDPNRRFQPLDTAVQQPDDLVTLNDEQ